MKCFRYSVVMTELNFFGERAIPALNEVFKALRISPKLIVVGGAHHGNTSLEYLQNFEHSYVDAFEPDDRNYAQLSLNLDRYVDQKRAVLHNVALGEASKIQSLHRFSHDATHSFFTPGKMELWDEPVHQIDSLPVVCRTLDEIYENHPKEIDLLHLDTQGSELEILVGAKNMLEGGRIRVMRIEVEFETIYSDQPLFFDIQRNLNPYFRLAALVDVKMRQGNIPVLAWADAIFVNRSLPN